MLLHVPLPTFASLAQTSFPLPQPRVSFLRYLLFVPPSSFFCFHFFLFVNTSFFFMVQVSLSGLSVKRFLQFLSSFFFSRLWHSLLPLIPNSIKHISPRRTWHMSITKPNNAFNMCHTPLPTNTRHISLPYGFSSWVYPTHTQTNNQNTYHPKGKRNARSD